MIFIVVMKTIRHLADVLPRTFGAQFRYQLIMATKLLMKGNEALAEAAIRAGLKAYFGYPITPQSELLEYLVRGLPKRGDKVEHKLYEKGMILGVEGAGEY